ncbi:hypothetical protein SDC9_205541 [bioreactor metagenome]|uniref:Uncharacterized protein n=1 Tax=bioreactor metagenome TaxID=1076179 RepID=A0A645J2C6_9ZZZZ
MQMVRECGPCVCRHEALPEYAAEVHSGQGCADLPDGELVAVQFCSPFPDRILHTLQLFLQLWLKPCLVGGS